ncbi:MAG: hypothetical protein QOG75_2759 [Mycobacterium sp.]|nr:hypothetical protein [Mycobacterium sp.]
MPDPCPTGKSEGAGGGVRGAHELASDECAECPSGLKQLADLAGLQFGQLGEADHCGTKHVGRLDEFVLGVEDADLVCHASPRLRRIAPAPSANQIQLADGPTDRCESSPDPKISRLFPLVGRYQCR